MDRDSLPLVTIFGASGFVGTQLVQVLARRGHRILAAVRRPDLAGHLKPLGDVGQVVPIQANLRYPDSIARAVSGAGIVINLVGVGFERGAQSFEAVHVAGARAVADAAKAQGARLIHMSAIGADPDSPSSYLASKGRGEAVVLEADPEAILFRPSLMFGVGDEFFNMMGFMARLLPALPVIGGKSRLQPVYVGDTADAFAAATSPEVKGGRAYELGGPEVVTMRDLMERILKTIHRNNLLVPLPAGIARLLAAPMQILPTPSLTPDRVTLMGIDGVVSPAAQKAKRTLQGLGVTPTPMDAILPSYLWRFRPNGQFDKQPA